MLDTEDHGAGVALLPPLAIHREPHVEVLRILDLVLGDEPRPDRAEGLAALALVPLAARAFDLEYAFRHVVRQEVTGDDAHRLVAGEIARTAADHNAQFDLIVELA